MGSINQSRVNTQIQLMFVETIGCGYQACSCQWVILKSEAIGSFSNSNGCVVYLNFEEFKEVNTH